MEVMEYSEIDIEVSEEEQLAERLAFLGQTLQLKLETNAGQKTTIEDRWIADLYQYHGQYDSASKVDLENQGNSTVFVNLTRPKTQSTISRLGDMLFPTDDKNYSVGPTPVPDIEQAAGEEREKPLVINGQIATDKQTGQPITEADLDTLDFYWEKAKEQEVSR